MQKVSISGLFTGIKIVMCIVSHDHPLLIKSASKPIFSWAFAEHYSANTKEKMKVELYV